jgi:hypothetical protein
MFVFLVLHVLGRNLLDGTIPDSLGSLTDLEVLGLGKSSIVALACQMILYGCALLGR